MKVTSEADIKEMISKLILTNKDIFTVMKIEGGYQKIRVFVTRDENETPILVSSDFTLQWNTVQVDSYVSEPTTSEWKINMKAGESPISILT